MRSPLAKYEYLLPTGDDLGAFGVERKHDIHTGIDLYCEQLTEVHSIEDGIIVAIEWFTGPMINMPWWNDTMAIAIEGKSGVINYGEVTVSEGLSVGDTVTEGQVIGLVIPVLKVDKGKVPSTSMLHLELYTDYNGKWAMWELGKPQPENLLNPTNLLSNILQ